MDVAEAHLYPRQGRIQFIQDIICHKGILLEIGCSDLAKALIYNYDQNSFAGGVCLNETEAFAMATE